MRNSHEETQEDRKEEDREIMRLCDRIREMSLAIHNYLGPGHLEKVYERALAHRMTLAAIAHEVQHPIPVRDEDGTSLGDYMADLFVESRLIIEVKAARALAQEHVAQILGYLRGARVRHGLLVNFGAPKLEIRKFVWGFLVSFLCLLVANLSAFHG